MSTYSLTKRIIPTFVLFLFTFCAYAQLPDFTLTVTPTPQTCFGNGALNFSVSGTNSSASIDYSVYLLPNTTTAITVTTDNVATGLGAGNYLVIATQSLGTESNTSSAEVTIENQVTPLSYTLTPTHVRCGNDGAITVNVNSGNPVSYEIIDGPVTVPLQSDNVFNNLPEGIYVVRAYDDCGEGVVVTIQLVQINTNVILGDVTFPVAELPDCNTISVGNTYAMSSNNEEIFWPLTYEYTVYPPGGGTPTIVTEVLPSGDETVAPTNFIANIPFYHDQEYYYDLEVTDVCGNVFTRENNIVNQHLGFSATSSIENCTFLSFKIAPFIYVGPINVNFISAPAGFNPSDFSASHPTFASMAEYASTTASVPEGVYTVEITDACGRSYTDTFDVQQPENQTQVITDAVCGSDLGSIQIWIQGRTIDTVTMISAPAEYTGTLPEDVSAYVGDQEGFLMDGLPIGTYEFLLVDTCGEEYNEIVELEPTTSGGTFDMNVLQRPGCEEGYGSIRLTSEADLESMIVTSGPAEFSDTYPVDVSYNIADNGNFYMNSFPAGDYTFDAIDACGAIGTKDVTVEGYTITQNDINVIPYCGSFQLSIQHQSNGNYIRSFWVQYYDEATGTWGHPETGEAYTDGLPTEVNSIYVDPPYDSNPTFYFAVGDYRVIKTFYYLDNGTTTNVLCFNVISEFTFTGGPEITEVYSFPCADGLTEAAVEVDGVPPFSYKITTKDGEPFLIDNAGSNIFSGLESGYYNFQVTDACQNIVNAQFNINATDPLAITATDFCEGEEGTLSVQPLSFLSYEWYSANDPDTVLSNNNILIFTAFDSDTQAGVYYVDIIAENPTSCMNTTLEYEIEPNAMPNAGNDDSVALCNEGNTIDLTAYLSSPHDAGGTWEDVDASGMLSGNMLDTDGLAEGTYNFRYTVMDVCGVISDEAVITLTFTDTPEVPDADTVAPICEGDDIELGVTTIAGASYQWTGPNNFTSTEESPVITNAAISASGTYSVTATINGCTSQPATVEVIVNTNPNAGDDDTITLCNEGSTVDLTAYLSAPHDAGGTWEDVDSSGMLSGNMLDTNGLAEGTYNFRYTVVGCDNVTDEAVITITLNDTPQAPVPTAVNAVCEGEDIQLSVNNVTGASYQWTGPDNFSSTEQNPFITGVAVSASGTYSVTATVNGCTSQPSTVNVTINPLPDFTIGGDASLCEGQSTMLDINPQNFDINNASLAWYHDGEELVGVNSQTIEVFEIGQYDAVINTNGCETQQSIEVTPKTVDFDIVLDGGCVNFEYILSIDNIEEVTGSTFVWTGPDGYYYVGEEANISDLTPGEYMVTITTADGCSEQDIIIVENTSCEIPRGISPNDDEYNQSFDLSNLDVIDLQIFNRYGLQVYERRNYVNEWHGQSDKGELPAGTYFYVATLSAGKKVTGWVYLQRQVN
ncbi:hypothetical protein GCM10007424_15930 [Flavobacterium suaedae]|uniref:Immunoglobulin domain-containing protein n=1 Tax=Flavobacterium suaedae TaxID=1767027 RepID=A0ABQ1JX45_9FLAO|nr:gliding motility-associated C-terminal domain-containing protein [Flavobacterium suaedae]GGB76722.1 hypothetical protein GCM10007424_15930 [Flavobacterium suaedae]